MEGDDLWSTAITGGQDNNTHPLPNNRPAPPHNYVGGNYDEQHENVNKDYYLADRPRYFSGKRSYDDGQYKYSNDAPNNQSIPHHHNFKRHNSNHSFNQPESKRKNPNVQTTQELASKKHFSEKRNLFNMKMDITKSDNVTSSEVMNVEKHTESSPWNRPPIMDGPSGPPAQSLPSQGTSNFSGRTDGIVLGMSHEDKLLYYNTRTNSGTEQAKYDGEPDLREQAWEDYNRFHYVKKEKPENNNNFNTINFNKGYEDGFLSKAQFDRIKEHELSVERNDRLYTDNNKEEGERNLERLHDREHGSDSGYMGRDNNRKSEIDDSYGRREEVGARDWKNDFQHRDGGWEEDNRYGGRDIREQGRYGERNWGEDDGRYRDQNFTDSSRYDNKSLEDGHQHDDRERNDPNRDNGRSGFDDRFMEKDDRFGKRVNPRDDGYGSQKFGRSDEHGKDDHFQSEKENEIRDYRMDRPCYPVKRNMNMGYPIKGTRNAGYRNGTELNRVQEDYRDGNFNRVSYEQSHMREKTTIPKGNDVDTIEIDDNDTSEESKDENDLPDKSKDDKVRKSNKDDIKQMLIDAGNKSVLDYRKKREEKSSLNVKPGGNATIKFIATPTGFSGMQTPTVPTPVRTSINSFSTSVTNLIVNTIGKSTADNSFTVKHFAPGVSNINVGSITSVLSGHRVIGNCLIPVAKPPPNAVIRPFDATLSHRINASQMIPRLPSIQVLPPGALLPPGAVAVQRPNIPLLGGCNIIRHPLLNNIILPNRASICIPPANQGSRFVSPFTQRLLSPTNQRPFLAPQGVQSNFILPAKQLHNVLPTTIQGNVAMSQKARVSGDTTIDLTTSQSNLPPKLSTTSQQGDQIIPDPGESSETKEGTKLLVEQEDTADKTQTNKNEKTEGESVKE